MRLGDTGRYHDPVRRGLDGVRDYVAGLPGPLSDHARLLLGGMAATSSPGGRWEDLFEESADPPVLYASLALVADLDGDIDTTLVDAITTSMALTRMLTHLYEGMAGGVSTRVGSALADDLARAVSAAIVVHGEDAVVAHTSGWRRFHRRLVEAPPTFRSPQDVFQAGSDRFAPFLAGPVALLAATHRLDMAGDIMEALDGVHALVSARRDLSHMRADLLSGRPGPAVQWASGLSRLESRLLSHEQVAGAVLLSGAPRRLGETGLRLGERCGRLAEDRGFTALATLVFDQQHRLHATVRLFDVAPLASAAPTLPSPTGTDEPDPLRSVEEAAGAARRYLLADPTLRDSWEIHRWGLTGLPEVMSPFPAGLIIEILARHGVDLTGPADDFIRAAHARRFAYYDHPALPHVDSDTVAMVLRLDRWTACPRSQRRVLDDCLALLSGRIGAAGEIPVWLTADDHTALGGEGCGVVAAHVVLGLVDHDPDGPVLERTARHVLSRFLSEGPAMSVNYPPAYALAVMAGLVRRLRIHGLFRDVLEPVTDAMEDHIRRQDEGPATSPQTAALLTSACCRAELEVDRHWIDVVVESQRGDGRWQGEPFFFVPHRTGSVRWYASDLTTTALCYDALETVRRRRMVRS